jgi:hypothetical protein
MQKHTNQTLLEMTTTMEEKARLIDQIEMLKRELKDAEEKARSAHNALCDAEKAHKEAWEKALAADHCLKVAQGGGLVYTEGHPRPYFIPAQIDDQLARSQRSCVKACLAKLGSEILLTDGPQHVMWPEILTNVCPEGIELYSFTDATDLKERAGDNLDHLYVAVVNKVVGIATMQCSCGKRKTLGQINSSCSAQGNTNVRELLILAREEMLLIGVEFVQHLFLELVC